MEKLIAGDKGVPLIFGTGEKALQLRDAYGCCFPGEEELEIVLESEAASPVSMPL